MTAAQTHLGIVVLLISCAVAQNPTPFTVRKVTTSRQGSDLRIEITVSAPVKPSVDTAMNPNRILLDFPNTICNNNTKSVSVHANGVRQVRTAQHSTTPYITRVVLDLDEVLPYVVTAEGNSIILTVAGEEQHVSHGAPVAATSGNVLAGVFRRHRDGTPPVIGDSSSNSDPAMPAPPPAVAGPEFQPPSSGSSATALPPPPPAVARPQPAAVGQSSTAAPTTDQKQIAVTSKPAEPVVPSTASVAAAPKAEEKPLQIAAAPVPAQPTAAVPGSTAPAANSTQPAPVPTVAPEPVAPKAEEKTVAVAAPAPPALAPASEATTPSPEPKPNASDTIAEAAEPSPSPEPAAAPASTLIARSDDP